MIPPPRAPQRTYQFMQEMSVSDFNRVFLAQDEQEGRYWAVKELHAPNPDDVETFFADFAREAEHQMAARHAGLPGVAEYFVHESNAYLVKEYIDGRTLKDMVLNNGGPLPLESVMTWGDQVAEAVQAAHAIRPPLIVQGLKPNNIVLPPAGRPRIMDLGTARFFTGDLRVKLMSGLTPYYTSPEQAVGLEPDVRSDIYSLGALMWFLLTGRDPVPVDGVVPNVRDFRRDTPQRLADALEACLRQRGSERHASVTGLRSLFQRVVSEGKGSRFTVDEVHVQLIHVKRGERRLQTLHLHQDAADNTVYVESTADWIQPIEVQVTGRKPEVDFYVDATGLKDDETHRGKLILTSGQYRKEIPVTISLQQPVLRQILRIIAPA